MVGNITIGDNAIFAANAAVVKMSEKTKAYGNDAMR